MDERGLDAHERDVGEERRFRKPEDVDGDIGQAARHGDVDEVEARASEPVHRLRAE